MSELTQRVLARASSIKSAAARTAVAGTSLLVVGLAKADDATDPGIAAINALKTTGSAYIAAAFGVAVLMTAGFWGIKIMKKSFGAAK